MTTFRTQWDDLGDQVSLDTGTDASVGGLTRQEFGEESDINVLLARFGVNTPSRMPTYGAEVDYTLDLQQALDAIKQAEQANLQVPQELKAKYPTWRDVLTAAETGEYQNDLNALGIKKAEDAEIARRKDQLAEETAKILRRRQAEKDLGT